MDIYEVRKRFFFYLENLNKGLKKNFHEIVVAIGIILLGAGFWIGTTIRNSNIFSYNSHIIYNAKNLYEETKYPEALVEIRKAKKHYAQEDIILMIERKILQSIKNQHLSEDISPESSIEDYNSTYNAVNKKILENCLEHMQSEPYKNLLLDIYVFHRIIEEIYNSEENIDENEKSEKSSSIQKLKNISKILADTQVSDGLVLDYIRYAMAIISIVANNNSDAIEYLNLIRSYERRDINIKLLSSLFLVASKNKNWGKH